MKRLGFLALLMLVLCSAVLAQQGWRRYKIKEGALSVLTPGEPLHLVSDVKSGKHNFKVHVYALGEERKVGYAAAYLDFSKVALTPPIEIILQGFQKGMEERGTLTQVYVQDVNTGKYQGRDYIYRTSNDLHLLVRVIVADKKLYSLLSVGPKSSLGAQEVADFMNSMKIGK